LQFLQFCHSVVSRGSTWCYTMSLQMCLLLIVSAGVFSHAYTVHNQSRLSLIYAVPDLHVFSTAAVSADSGQWSSYRL